MSKKVYKTEGRQRLIGFFESHPDCQFTVEELCVSLNGLREDGQKDNEGFECDSIHFRM